jgi:CBS domain-containing protein
MLEKHTRYMPVVEGGAVIGVLSFHDVAKAVLEEQAFENRMLKGYISDSAARRSPLTHCTGPAGGAASSLC